MRAGRGRRIRNRLFVDRAFLETDIVTVGRRPQVPDVKAASASSITLFEMSVSVHSMP
jgi:hypothetical protein